MENYVKIKIRAGKSVTGIWSIIPSPMVCEIIGSTGLDFMILDMEHGAFDLTVLAECVRATAGSKCSPLVRVPAIDQTLIQRVLDTGAHGIIAPQVKSVDDAKQLVACCKFFPAGIRGYNPYTRVGHFTADHRSLYLNDSFPLIAIIIENLDAYGNLDELLLVEGIDVYYLGIYDMSCSFGVRGELMHSSVTEFVDDCSKRIAASGKRIGKMIDCLSEELLAVSPPMFYVLQPDTFQIRNGIMKKLVVR